MLDCIFVRASGHFVLPTAAHLWRCFRCRGYLEVMLDRVFGESALHLNKKLEAAAATGRGWRGWQGGLLSELHVVVATPGAAPRQQASGSGGCHRSLNHRSNNTGAECWGHYRNATGQAMRTACGCTACRAPSLQI